MSDATDVIGRYLSWYQGLTAAPDAVPRHGRSLDRLEAFVRYEEQHGPRPGEDPAIICVPQALAGFAAGFGRLGNRPTLDGEFLTPNRRLVAPQDYHGLVDILDGRPETINPATAVTGERIVQALRDTPGALAVVRVSPPNRREHVFLIVNDDRPEMTGLRPVDPQVRGAFANRLPTTGTGPLHDPWLRHLFLPGTQVMLFAPDGTPATIDDLIGTTGQSSQPGPARTPTRDRMSATDRTLSIDRALTPDGDLTAQRTRLDALIDPSLGKPGMAIGKESEGQVFAYPDDPPQKTVFARTRLLTVESGGTAPTTLEIVQIPTRVLPAERGWPDRYLMRQAERYTMLRLALYSRPAPTLVGVPQPTPISVVFPANAGYQVPAAMADAQVPPLVLNRTWMAQTTVAPTLRQITRAMRRIATDVPPHLRWADWVRDLAIAAADFGDAIATQLAPWATDHERDSLAGALAIGYGHIAALAIDVVERRGPKHFLPFLSRVSMSGLRRALPERMVLVLDNSYDHISQRVSAYFAERSPQYVRQGPPTDVLDWPMLNALPIRAFLDNLLLPRPPIEITPAVFGAHHYLADVDTHDGRIPGGVVPLEVRGMLRPERPDWYDITTMRLVGIMRQLYQETGEQLADGSRTRVEPPWGSHLPPAAVAVETTAQARIVDVDPAVGWVLHIGDAALLADPQDGFLRVVSSPLPAGATPDQVQQRTLAMDQLLQLTQRLRASGTTVGALTDLPAGVEINPRATPGRVVPTTTAYDATTEVTINVPVSRVLPTLLTLKQNRDRSKVWYEPASVAGDHLESAIAWARNAANTMGASHAATGYLALLYLEHAALVHVLYDALPETYAVATIRPDLPTLLAALPPRDQELITNNHAQLIDSFQKTVRQNNERLLDGLAVEASQMGGPQDPFHRPLWPTSDTIHGRLTNALTPSPNTPADHILLDLRYIQEPIHATIHVLLNVLLNPPDPFAPPVLTAESPWPTPPSMSS